MGCPLTDGRDIVYNRGMKRNHVLCCVLAFAFVTLSALSEPVDWEQAETVAPGVKATGYRTETPRLMECRLLRVDLRQKGLSFVATKRAAEWGEAMPDVTNRTVIVDTRREPTEAFMARCRQQGLNVVAAVNTSPWNPWEPPWTHRFARLPHLSVSDGQVVSHNEKPGPMLVIWKDNTAVITNDLAAADVPRVAVAHPGFSIIMRGGQAPERKPGKPRLAPRTAFGISSDGRYLYALIVDGRQPDWSQGADMADLAILLKEAGAADAINMDGGGSTTLVTLAADGKTLVHRNRHEPSYRHYRSVSQNLGIVVCPKECRESN